MCTRCSYLPAALHYHGFGGLNEIGEVGGPTGRLCASCSDPWQRHHKQQRQRGASQRYQVPEQRCGAQHNAQHHKGTVVCTRENAGGNGARDQRPRSHRNGPDAGNDWTEPLSPARTTASATAEPGAGTATGPEDPHRCPLCDGLEAPAPAPEPRRGVVRGATP